MSSTFDFQNLNQEKIYAHILNLCPVVGAKTLLKLHNHYGSFEIAYRALNQGQNEILELQPRINSIIQIIRKINPEKEILKLKKSALGILLFTEKKYSKLLNEIPDKPPILYFRGNIEEIRHPSIAIVGTRKISGYGKAVTENLTADLVQAGLCIVSGLAIGIDACAHTQTLRSNGLTIAVCPGGIDNDSIYPRINFALAQNIIKNNGLILSENPPGTGTLKHIFPIRNRIIAGLTLGTIVIEAGENSGTLYTARAALEYNREVFAVPGDITNPGSIGPNNLIKMGAKLITSANDILDELSIESIPKNLEEMPDLSSEENIVLNLLDKNPLHIDKVITLSRLNTSLVNSTLTILEIKGLIKNLGNNQYIKVI